MSLKFELLLTGRSGKSRQARVAAHRCPLPSLLRGNLNYQPPRSFASMIPDRKPPGSPLPYARDPLHTVRLSDGIKRPPTRLNIGAEITGQDQRLAGASVIPRSLIDRGDGHGLFLAWNRWREHGLLLLQWSLIVLATRVYVG